MTIPAWIRNLPVKRAASLIWRAYLRGDIREPTREAVRAKGRTYWLTTPNLGPKTYAAIHDAVGEFDDLPPLIKRGFH